MPSERTVRVCRPPTDSLGGHCEDGVVVVQDEAAVLIHGELGGQCECDQDNPMNCMITIYSLLGAVVDSEDVVVTITIPINHRTCQPERGDVMESECTRNYGKLNPHTFLIPWVA